MKTRRSLRWLLLIALLLPLALRPAEAGRPAPRKAPDACSLPPQLQAEGLPSDFLYARIEPELLKQALTHLSTPGREGEPLRFLVYLREQADLSPAWRKQGRLARRRWVAHQLQEVARRHQGSLQAYLSARQARGHVRAFTSYWIFNGLGVIADAETLLELARRPEVEVIRLDRRRRLPEVKWRTEGRHQTSSEVEWNLQRIRADVAWNALGIEGTGVVVANVDTGVDWEHPALHTRYRGYDPKGLDRHEGNWFCATHEGYLYPGDGYGHGTHTMGLMVGKEGESSIGVAPGAQWIAVKAFDNRGVTYESWLHAGLQWLLAPEGDVALAPDVVNNSWGSAEGGDLAFQPDVQALRAAGILPIFSAGNDGPDAGTISSPASFPQSVAVGATDPDDRIASFSSRGPSPWGETKPELVAPGVDVRSSMPGGAYASADGTSMAAPHVAGVAALLLQADPSLTVTETEEILLNSARQLGDPVPNNDYGWGMVDAYEAVAIVMHAAVISGTVRRAGDDAPLAGARVQCVALDGARRTEVATDDQGRYQVVVAVGSYSMTASAFAYYPQVAPRLVLTGGQHLVQDFSLSPRPTGTLTGWVTEAAAGSPLSATIEVADVPVQAHSDPQSGLYSLTLPAGTYTVSVKAPGYRVGRARAITITSGQVVQRDFALPTAPTILVVDSGAWYYDSEIDYFTQVLDELDYLYDLWSIRQPFAEAPDVPSAEDLAGYDLVIWSAPRDSPGYVGAGEAIADFLEGGGGLFLTGQDVAYWDGGGAMASAPYFRDALQAQYVRDDSEVRTVEAVEGPFAGLTFDIQGGDGAGNQLYPDEIAPISSDYAAPVLRYRGDGWAAQQVGLCQPYRVLYLAFGFEAIDARTARRAVMDQAVDWLVGPRASVGLELQTLNRQPQVAPAGQTVSHTLRLRNTGDGGDADTLYEVTLSPSTWPVTLTSPIASQRALTLHLAPCHSTTLTVEVMIPEDTAGDVTQRVTVTARVLEEKSGDLPVGLSHTATLTTKTPAPVLLIDDDRWYDQEARYQAALEEAGIAYDNWEVGWKLSSADGSPSLATLEMYPLLLWFTGYDWYDPLADEDETRLAEYLAHGGRLLLSSQDYLFARGLTNWAMDYLGVLTYTEDLTATTVLGVEGSPLGDGLGPYALVYPFRNWSDALTPTVRAEPAFLGEHGRPIALTHSHEVGATAFKSTFFAFPLEALPDEAMAEVMGRAVGWLSWLGDTALSVDKTLAADGERLTYTAWLRNDGPASLRCRFEGGVPFHTAYVPGSASEGGAYEGGQVVWEGILEPQDVLTFTYQVELDDGLPPGTWVTNVSRVEHVGGGVGFPRWARTRVNAPDLATSRVAADRDEVKSGGVVTYQVLLRNEGLADAATASLTVTLPTALRVITGSLHVEGGGTATALGEEVLWRGLLPVAHSVTVTYRALAVPTVVGQCPATQVVVDDGMGMRWRREIVTTISPHWRYLPLAWRSADLG